MNWTSSTRRVSLGIVLVAIGLAGCQQQKGNEAPAAAASETASAAPDAKPGITVSDGKLVLPLVTGRPGAAYFTLTNGSVAPVTLAAVTIDGAGKAEMHETKGGSMTPLASLELKPGETAKFERGGKHVMAFDLGDAAKAGGTVEMTLTFAGGDKVSTPLKIETMNAAPAGDMADMPGMKH